MKKIKVLPIFGIGVLALASCGSMPEITRAEAKTRYEAISTHTASESFKMPSALNIEMTMEQEENDKIDSKKNEKSSLSVKAGFDTAYHKLYLQTQEKAKYYDEDEGKHVEESQESSIHIWAEKESNQDYLYIASYAFDSSDPDEKEKNYTKQPVTPEVLEVMFEKNQTYLQIVSYIIAGQASIAKIIETTEETVINNMKEILVDEEGCKIEVKHRFGSSNESSLQAESTVKASGHIVDEKDRKIEYSIEEYKNYKIENYLFSYGEENTKGHQFYEGVIDIDVKSKAVIDVKQTCNFSKPNLSGYVLVE